MIRSTKILITTAFLSLSLNTFASLSHEKINSFWKVASCLTVASYGLTLLNSYLVKSKSYSKNPFEFTVWIGGPATALMALVGYADLAFQSYEDNVESSLSWYKSRNMARAACATAMLPILYAMGAYDTLYNFYYNITPTRKGRTLYIHPRPGSVVNLSL